MSEAETILQNAAEFLQYLKSKFPLYHDSNIFFRDLHYGVWMYLEGRMKKKTKYLRAESIALDVVRGLETQGILKKVDGRTWLLVYPEFALPRPVPAAKPVPAAQPMTK